MKTKLLFSLIFSSALILNAQTYIINDDFEDGIMGNLPANWILKYNGTGTANQKIVDNPVKNGTKAFQMEGSSGWASEFYQEPSSIPNLVTVETWVNPEKILSGLAGSIGLGNFTIGSWGTRTSRLQFSNGKISTLYQGGSTYVIQDYTPGNWYHFKMEHNLLAKTYKVYINGTQVSGDNGSEVVTDFPMHPTVSSIHVMLAAGNSGTTKMIWDDIKVYETDKEVAYYPFNGNANDESGNENHGTVNGATLTTDRFGNPDSAYYFDGTTNYISIANNPKINIQTGESFSISYWAKHDAQNNATYMISKYKGSSGEPSYAIGTGSIGDSYSWYEFSPGGIESRGTIDLNDNNWHNITSVFKSGESVSIYVDGILDISHPVTHTGSIINSRNLTIGCGSNIAQFYKGSIDDVKIYKKALSETEIQNEANGLIAYYPFNGNANDESGNNHNGTVFEAALTTDKDGNTDSAYSFDGINDYIDLGDWENGGEMSFTFWARWDAFSNWNRIIEIGNGQRNDDIMIGSYYSSSDIAFYVNKGTTSNYVMMTAPSAITLNQWNFYSATVDANGIMKIYKNDALLSTEASGLTPNKVLRTQQHLGRSLYPGDTYFKGAIDELRIYNRALSASELLSIYNNSSLSITEQDINVTPHFYVYNNTLYLKDHVNLKDVKIIEVYNLLGQQVFKTNHIEKTVSLESLKTGLYILKIDFKSNGVQTKKFIIH